MWSYVAPNVINIQDETLVVMDEETKAMHLKYGVAAIPFSSQANGFFTKFNLNNLTEQDEKMYYNNENIARFKRAKKVAEIFGVNISEVVLGYLISQPFVTIPVVGCRTKKHLEDSLKASDLKFSKSTMNYLETGL